jgi:hypothetical protein
MDADPNWDNRHTRPMGEVYAGDELEVEYSISNKVEGNIELGYKASFITVLLSHSL